MLPYTTYGLEKITYRLKKEHLTAIVSELQSRCPRSSHASPRLGLDQESRPSSRPPKRALLKVASSDACIHLNWQLECRTRGQSRDQGFYRRLPFCEHVPTSTSCSNRTNTSQLVRHVCIYMSLLMLSSPNTESQFMEDTERRSNCYH